jgi:hypothetical protein
MLRIFVLLLLLLNGLYFAWSQGLLQELGFAPTQQREPQRLRQQIRPEALSVLTSQEARAAQAPTPAKAKPSECLQAGLFDEPQSAALRRDLESGLPTGSWTLQNTVLAGRWIVYMGKYANADELQKKRKELANLNLKFEPLGNPNLELGLSLGGYDTQGAANAALEAVSRRGVRTARVLLERAEQAGNVLRLPAVDEALRARLEELKPALAGKSLKACS